LRSVVQNISSKRQKEESHTAQGKHMLMMSSLRES
jgi:hypothetical protein